MLNSMTGYFNHSVDLPEGQLIFEIKSVNHRYLDLSLQLPESFRHCDATVRERVKVYLKRGKVEVSVKFKLSKEQSTKLSCNLPLLEELETMVAQVSSRFPQATLSLFDLIQYKGVVCSESSQVIEPCMQMFEAGLQSCLEKMVDVRAREGAGIAAFMGDSLDKITVQLSVIKRHVPEFIVLFKERLQRQFESLQAQLDQDRLEQELIWYAQKSDITEELQRLTAHIDEFRSILSAGGVVGRRLDFLIQELNREANTIASKSVMLEVTQAAVDIKVCLEQIREQVQNIE